MLIGVGNLRRLFFKELKILSIFIYYSSIDIENKIYKIEILKLIKLILLKIYKI